MVRYVANILVYLALTVWIGGLIAFGAVVAPALFTDAGLPRTVAGAVNSMILGRMNTLEIACAVVVVGGTFYGLVRVHSWMNVTAFVISIGMLLTAGYYSYVLFPEMEDLRVAIGSFESIPTEKMHLKKSFDEGHRLYSTLARLVLAGGIVVLGTQTASLVRYSGRRTHRRPPGHRVAPHETVGTHVGDETGG